MTTQREMSRINKLVEIIHRDGPISKVQLVMQSGMSVSYYDKLKPYLEEIYQHQVRYDRDTKTWHKVTAEEYEVRNDTSVKPGGTNNDSEGVNQKEERKSF